MKKILLGFISLLVSFVSVRGQAISSKSIMPLHFNSINQLGLLSGSSGQSFQCQTLNGVSQNNWFGGVGTGLDFYGTRSVPLFIDIRKKLGNAATVPFVYVDGGLNFSWATDQQKFDKGYTGTGKAGAYFDGGIGWSIKTKGTGAILLSAGYCYKQIKEKTEVFSIWSWPTTGDKIYEYYNYQYRRIVIKVGIQL